MEIALEGKLITLVPLSPGQAYEGQLKIKREAGKNCESESLKKIVEKERGKNMGGRKKEGEGSFSVQAKDIKVTYCSKQPLLKHEYKKICFVTNDINLFLLSINVSLFQKFEAEFPSIKSSFFILHAQLHVCKN